jgi:hypothetical protein
MSETDKEIRVNARNWFLRATDGRAALIAGTALAALSLGTTAARAESFPY